MKSVLGIRMSSPGEVAFPMLAPLSELRREHFYVLTLNANSVVTGAQCIARGFVDACPVDPREVFRFAVLKRASAIIVVHNHPSGSLEPSGQDILLTEKLERGATLLGFRLLDHLIIAGGEYASFLERGHMRKAS